MAYLVRAVADGRAGASQLRSWTPLGWYELVAPERDRAWTPVVALVAVALLGVLAAAALERRRDLGAAWWQERPGPALARPFPPGWPGALAGPASLATRLFAGAGLAWSLGLGAFGAVLAALAPDVGDLLRDNPAMADLVRSATSGGADDLGLAYLGMTFSLMTAAVSAVAVQGVLAARAEEVQGRAEPVLATPTPRTAWLGAHLLAGLLAAVAVAAVLGGASQLAWTAAGGGGTRVLLAGVNLVPVAACWAGVAVLAVGWWPRAAGASVWGALAASFLASFVAPLLGWPSAATAWSPFAHVEPVPAVGLAVVPALALLAAGAAAALLGAVGVRRRDVTP
ncbi:MAG: hypothetical protein U0Q15_08425 [Kineosporiaceae bacterium]